MAAPPARLRRTRVERRGQPPRLRLRRRSASPPDDPLVRSLPCPQQNGLTLHRRYELRERDQGQPLHLSVADAIGAERQFACPRDAEDPRGPAMVTGNSTAGSSVAQAPSANHKRPMVLPDIVAAGPADDRPLHVPGRPRHRLVERHGTGTGAQPVPRPRRPEDRDRVVHDAKGAARRALGPALRGIQRPIRRRPAPRSSTSALPPLRARISARAGPASPARPATQSQFLAAGPRTSSSSARDAAGHEDDNTVQLAAVNACAERLASGSDAICTSDGKQLTLPTRPPARMRRRRSVPVSHARRWPSRSSTSCATSRARCPTETARPRARDRHRTPTAAALGAVIRHDAAHPGGRVLDL